MTINYFENLVFNKNDLDILDKFNGKITYIDNRFVDIRLTSLDGKYLASNISIDAKLNTVKMNIVDKNNIYYDEIELIQQLMLSLHNQYNSKHCISEPKNFWLLNTI